MTKDVNVLYTMCRQVEGYKVTKLHEDKANLLTWNHFGINQARAGVEEYHALTLAYPAGGAQPTDGGQERGPFRADPQSAPRKLEIECDVRVPIARGYHGRFEAGARQHQIEDEQRN